jgi:hypothetical protein
LNLLRFSLVLVQLVQMESCLPQLPPRPLEMAKAGGALARGDQLRGRPRRPRSTLSGRRDWAAGCQSGDVPSGLDRISGRSRESRPFWKGHEMPFNFRVRFDLPPVRRLGIQAEELVLSQPGASHVVKLVKGEPNKPRISDCERVAVVGHGYPTEEVARENGERMRDALTLAFSELYIGADFGDRAPRHVLTDAGRAFHTAQQGQRVENDTHGLMVYEREPSEPSPLFFHQKLELSVVANPPRLTNALAGAIARAPRLNERHRLAFDLYSASFFEPSADARLLMQMMAVETVLELAPRSATAQAHVAELIKSTGANGALGKAEKESIRGSLKWLYNESIGQGGRKLARRLGARTYLGKNPEQFFTYCYTVRSRLVHGDQTRPTREEVGDAAAQFELFVGDLLAVLATEPSPPSAAQQSGLKPKGAIATARAWVGERLVRAGYRLIDS